jgi:hypothetical protein
MVEVRHFGKEIYGEAMQFAIVVWKHNKANKPIWFTKVYEALKWDDRVKAVACTDVLEDLFLMTYKWQKVDNKWTYCMYVTDECRHLIEHADGLGILNDRTGVDV